MKAFKTHTGQVIKGKELKNVLGLVADDLIELAYAIRKEDVYSSHVTEETKDQLLQEALAEAEKARKGEINGLWLLQRINTKVTGECVGLLA
jgi:hypothetical protein